MRSERRRERIPPAESIPVVHVVAEPHDLDALNRLVCHELAEQRVGRRTARAALGREQFGEHNRASLWRRWHESRLDAWMCAGRDDKGGQQSDMGDGYHDGVPVPGANDAVALG